MEWARANIVDFDKLYNQPLIDNDYTLQYKPVTTTTSLENVEPNIDISFVNIQDRQIFNSDVDVRVRITSNTKIQEKTLFVNNIYVGELNNINDNIYGIRIPKSMLNEENEIIVRVMDEHMNILEKGITILINI